MIQFGDKINKSNYKSFFEKIINQISSRVNIDESEFKISKSTYCQLPIHKNGAHFEIWIPRESPRVIKVALHFETGSTIKNTIFLEQAYNSEERINLENELQEKLKKQILGDKGMIAEISFEKAGDIYTEELNDWIIKHFVAFYNNFYKKIGSTNYKSVNKNWIFQYNPKKSRHGFSQKDFIEFISKKEKIPWQANQHSELMEVGDNIFFWRAGDDSGIYAIGKIVSRPYLIDGHNYVDVIPQRSLSRYVSREIVKNDNELGKLHIITQPHSTNFVLDNIESDLLNVLIDKNQINIESDCKEIFQESKLEEDGRKDAELQELLERANNNSKKDSKEVIRKIYQRIRNKNVSIYVKKISNGVCMLCRARAPFFDNYGNAYLEGHHIEWLAEEGKDIVENVVALCPNCHRKMHILNIKEDKERLKKIALKNARNC